MMCSAGEQPDPYEAEEGGVSHAAFASLLEDSAEELYESAPCGYLSTLMDGTVAKVNTTLLTWLDLRREEVVGRMRFSDLLSVGGKLYHETHFAPLLRMQGRSAASPWRCGGRTAAASPSWCRRRSSAAPPASPC